MRALMLVAAAALALGACRNNDQTDNNQNIDENLTAENIVSNDVTAIDAVTGDAANMAADVDYSNLADNSLDNMLNEGSDAKPRSQGAGRQSRAVRAVRQSDDQRRIRLRAGRAPCAPEGSGATSAGPSPARSPLRSLARSLRSPSAG